MLPTSEHNENNSNDNRLLLPPAGKSQSNARLQFLFSSVPLSPAREFSRRRNYKSIVFFRRGSQTVSSLSLSSSLAASVLGNHNSETSEPSARVARNGVINGQLAARSSIGARWPLGTSRAAIRDAKCGRTQMLCGFERVN